MTCYSVTVQYSLLDRWRPLCKKSWWCCDSLVIIHYSADCCTYCIGYYCTVLKRRHNFKSKVTVIYASHQLVLCQVYPNINFRFREIQLSSLDSPPCASRLFSFGCAQARAPFSQEDLPGYSTLEHHSPLQETLSANETIHAWCLFCSHNFLALVPGSLIRGISIIFT